MKKYLAGAVLSLGILVSPAFTQAATLTDAQVQAILAILSSFGADSATIASVQSALTGGTLTSSGPAFCYKVTSDLTVGNSGPSVSELNQALASSGIDTSDNTNVFDENTAADVVQFQAKYGIRQTGYVGPLTRAKLNALYGCNNSTSQTTTTTTASAVPTLTMTVSPTTVSVGQSATISWASANTTNCTLNGEGIYLSGTLTDSAIYQTHTNVITCAGPGGSVTQSARVMVTTNSTIANPIISAVQAPAGSAATIYVGERAGILGTGLSGHLTIRVGNQYVSVDNTSDTSVDFIVPELQTGSATSYSSVSVTNASGQTSNAYNVTVIVPTAPSLQVNQKSGAAPLTVTFTVSNSRGTADNGIYYTITFGDGQAGGFSRGGPFTLSHTYSSSDTYKATLKESTKCGTWECIGPVTTIGSVIITVSAQPTTATPNSLPTVSTLTPARVSSSSVTLNGSVNSAGTTGTTGWFRGGTANPGTCNDAFGVRVPSTGGTAFSPGYLATAFSQSATSLTPSTTYYYCAIASNPYGTSYGNVVSFTTPATTSGTGGSNGGTSGTSPVVTATLTQTSASTAAGNSYTVTWGSTNATSCTVAYTGPDGGGTISSGATSGSQTFNTPTVGTYVATNTCTSASGMTASQSVTHIVTAVATPNSVPIVSTTPASNITSSSVTLNGKVNSAGTTGTTGWFRGGTANPGTCNDSFGIRIPATGGTSFNAEYQMTTFSEPVSGLVSGTTYYYCAIAQNPFGKTYGTLVSFSTN